MQDKENNKELLEVVIKADTRGSSEAIIHQLENIKSEKIIIKVIHSGVGFINESVKSMLYREFGYPHPVTRMIQTVVSIITDKEKGVRYTNFDTQKMVEILTMMTDEWDDE